MRSSYGTLQLTLSPVCAIQSKKLLLVLSDLGSMTGNSSGCLCLQALLRNIASWLKPEGLVFVHIFTHKSLAYHFEVQFTT